MPRKIPASKTEGVNPIRHCPHTHIKSRRQQRGQGQARGMLRCRRRCTRKGSKRLVVSLAAGSPEHHTNQQSKEDAVQGSRAGTQEDPSPCCRAWAQPATARRGEEEKGAQGAPRLFSSARRQGQAKLGADEQAPEGTQQGTRKDQETAR